MNKQDLLNMEPGCELDMLVTKKVLDISAEKSETGEEESVKSFSTDSSQLWTIIDAMIRKNFLYNITNNKDEHTCVFDNIKTHRRYVVHAKTPMEAICKASILAVSF